MMRRFQRILDRLSIAAGFAVIVVFLVEELSTDATALRVASATSWIIWLVFLADFVVRWTREGGRAFWKAPATKIDLAVVLLTSPVIELFAATLGGWLNRVGVFRLLRLAPRFFQLLGRLSRLLRTATTALGSARTFRRLFGRRRFHYTFTMAMTIVCVFALLVWAAERDETSGSHPKGFLDALWWALATSTTIGYGDVAPTSIVGRAIGVLLMFMGIGITSIFTATIASAFLEEFEEEKKEHTAKEWNELLLQLKRIEDKVDRLDRC
jgi:hypothetical protein